MSSAVSIRQVTKHFGHLRALDKVSLESGEGEFFGLLGPNGAGKTTLISALAGLSKPDSGKLSIMGHDVQDDYQQARLRLGVVPQELVFDPFFTVRETLRFQSGYFGLSNNEGWIDEILENLDLMPKANTNMRRLSGGMKRRVLVAQALIHKPPVIVLDEPTAGVDVELRQGLWEFIKRLNRDGHTVILTTHYLEEAQALCNRVAMLKQGRVVALDTTQDLLARYAKHVLSFKIAHHALMPEALKARASISDGVWTITLADFTELEGIMAALREAKCVIEDMQLAKTDLEDIFINMMHRDESLPGNLS